MQSKRMQAVAGLAAALVLGAGGGAVAVAATQSGGSSQGSDNSTQQSGTRSNRPMPPCGPGARGGPPFLKAAASYLGLSQGQLRTKLRAGQTLSAVATAQGKSVDGLKQAIIDDATKHLTDAVSKGRLTEAQKTQMLTDLKSHIDDIVNNSKPPGPPPGGLGPPPG